MLSRAVKVLPYPSLSDSDLPSSGSPEPAGFVGPGDTPVGVINAEAAFSEEDLEAVTTKRREASYIFLRISQLPGCV